MLPDVGEPSEPPLIAPARGPPAWNDDPEQMSDLELPDKDLIAPPDPGF
jgi:hypothetical protein